MPIRGQADVDLGDQEAQGDQENQKNQNAGENEKKNKNLIRDTNNMTDYYRAWDKVDVVSQAPPSIASHSSFKKFINSQLFLLKRQENDLKRAKSL